jgi:hypothetical protein
MKQHLDVLAAPLEPMLTHHLQTAHLQLQALGQADEHWDSNSSRRSAIEPHPQDKLPHDIDILIDAARDVLAWLLVNNCSQAQTLIEKWFDSKVPLLKRLAVHGINENSRLTSDEKIGWILSRDLLWARNERHEVFQLLRMVFPGAKTETKSNLLEQAELGYQTKNEEVRQYEILKMLDWLRQADPKCADAAKRFKRALSHQPRYKTPEHLDLTHWIGSVHGPISPIAVDELLKKDPEQVLELLQIYQSDIFDGSSYEGLLDAISQACSRDFNWCMNLLGALRSKEMWSSDIWRVAFYGLRESSLNAKQWELVLVFLSDASAAYGNGHAISELLLNGIRKEEGKIPFPILAEAENLADTLWETIASQPGHEEADSQDWLSVSINHPGGKLTEFYIYALSSRRVEAGDKWSNLPVDYKDRFEQILADRNPMAEMGRVILASQLNYLAFLDAEWTRANVIPLLDWNKDARRAQQAWHGFLAWGHWTEGLLPDLLPLYVTTFDHLSALESMSEQFCKHMSNLAIFGSVNPLDSKQGWLNQFLIKLNVDNLGRWARCVRQDLGQLNEEHAANLWGRWLKKYWENRINGVPRQFENAEMAEMIQWPIPLKPIFAEVVDLICRSPLPDFPFTHFYEQLLERGFAQSFPHDSAKLVLQLLQAKARPFDFWEPVIELIEALFRSGISSDFRRAICEQLARLGYPNASDLWRGCQ